MDNPEPTHAADPEPTHVADPEPTHAADPEPTHAADPEPAPAAGADPAPTAGAELTPAADPRPTPPADRSRSAVDQHRRTFFARLSDMRKEIAEGDEHRAARIAAALERVGAEVVQDALRPQQRADGTPMKWSAVCCDRALGETAGSPAFLGWVRLAATPVREIKGALGGSAPRRPQRDRDRRGRDGAGRDEVSRRDIDQYGSDGQLSSRIVIPGLS